MKKRMVCLVLVAALLALTVLPVTAATASATVYVTVTNRGETVLAAKAVTVTDVDGDGALTVNDALYAAHEVAYNGGAQAGYSSYSSAYGLSLGKLWGDESGNFSYYHNNASCMSLADAVADGDTVAAFIFKDTLAYSDTYTYFDALAVTAEAGESVELTLSAAGYDASWNPVTLPVEGAVITVNGEKTEAVTDANGKAIVSVDAAGMYQISAVSDTQTLVPPVCWLTVTAAASSEPDVDTDTDADVEQDKDEDEKPSSPATGEEAPFVAMVLFVLSGALVVLTRKYGHVA